MEVAGVVGEVGARHGFQCWFKGSFDKANRTSIRGERGPGLDVGAAWLRSVRERTGLPVVADIHEPHQAAALDGAVDALQIPAFLCRQTDLLLAAGAVGVPVLWKKGQFVAPWQVAAAVEKLRSGGAPEVVIVERGSSFGHGDLVVDFRAMGGLVDVADGAIIDASHAAQRADPGGERTAGRRDDVRTLALAGMAAGADGLFIEVHPDPARAASDRDTQWPLDRLDALLATARAVWNAARR